MRGLVQQLIRYGAASAVALVVDWLVMIVLVEVAGLHYLAAAAAGFAAGATVAYVLSVAFVFTDRRVADPRVEFALFVLIGGVGLALNEVLMHAAVSWAGMHYALAKAPVSVAVFAVNFILRRSLLFRSGGAPAAA